MKNKLLTAVIIVVCMLSGIPMTRCESAGVAIRPLLQQDSLAQASRIWLADLVYERGTVSERRGDLAGAIRLWAHAYNLDSRDERIETRMDSAYGVLMRSVRRKYQEALFDLQFGRIERALKKFGQTHDLLGGIDPALEQEIISAMEVVEVREVRFNE